MPAIKSIHENTVKNICKNIHEHTKDDWTVLSGYASKKVSGRPWVYDRYLAELLDVSPVFLRSIEYGKRGMSIDTLAKLAAALQVSTDYILFGS